ncbi:aminotransferase class IV family protein [Sedimentimonas flavescens]|uniref:Probable branched-chain-amino-acid aminotransferase n=1 Tax=Sedimentimonas flavescens TaxID=2851012 RepID=A0ABT3A2S7_9RHOB|nr:aminotransferase class IV family protein [Sedimentimonas flavescens]MCV2880243.1 aminotransferase class IV family protein [Sedimentimonas flavescens]
MEEPFRADIPAGTRLIETFGWWPGEGARRWPLHRARMVRSAASLGFPCDLAELERAVAGIGPSEAPLRCRLTLDADGQVECTTARFDPAPGIWQVALAPERVSSADPWLGVKTTQRTLYDRARAALPPGIDELLFCNERGELCEGTITSIFVIDQNGRKLTPALSCGLLPGVLREQMLMDGWEEAVLTLEDLRRAKEVFVGNSFRGLIGARLAGRGSH